MSFKVFFIREIQMTSTQKSDYWKVASSNTSHLKAHAGFFRLLMKGILDPYVL